MSRLISLLLCLATLYVSDLGAQNLDNVDLQVPIVRDSPAKLAGTDTRDFFGWTAIFHAMEALEESDTIEERLRKLRVIVGAPWGSYDSRLNFDPFAPAQSQGGLVYNCPLTPGNNCTGVTGDRSLYFNNQIAANKIFGTIIPAPIVPPMRDGLIEGSLFDQAPDATITVTLPVTRDVSFESRRGQLMGATLFSNGDTFVACAPRWQYSTSTNPVPRGICYSSGRTLTGFVPLVPCAGNGGSDSLTYLGDDYCLGGTDALVQNNRVVISAPGFTAARGVVAATPVSTTTPTGFNLSPYIGFGSIVSPDVPSDQYLGFRLVSANIMTQAPGNPNLLASVPRFDSSYIGSITLFASSMAGDLDSPTTTSARGTQMGEFFGYSLAAGDFNNDRYDEVIVGAPMYTHGINTQNPLPEMGRVYIFRNAGGTLSADAVILESPLLNSANSRPRFGSSVAFLGDIDNDGYGDLAVGAPYYTEDQYSGVVFIYYGRANMSELATQTPFMISAAEVGRNTGRNVSTFGWSLFGGQDVDANQYNDLLVGAYESQSVFVLRTLPVADVSVTFVPFSDSVDVRTQSSFDLMVMARFNGTGVASNLNVNFELTEVIVGENRRVFFGPNEDMTATGRGIFNFAAPNTDITVPVTVYTDNRTTNFDPFVFELRLLPITRGNTNPFTDNEPVTSLSSFPRLRNIGDTRTNVTVTNVCGDNGCSSDVFFFRVLPMNLGVVVSDDERVTGSLDFVVRNVGPEPVLNELNMIISRLPEFVLSVRSDQVSCGAKTNGSVLCQLISSTTRSLDPMGTISATLDFTYSTQGLVGNEPPLEADLMLVIPPVNGNQDPDLTDNSQTIMFVPMAVANLSVSINFAPPTSTYSDEAPMVSDSSSLGTEIGLVVTINNRGPSTITNGQLRVFLPSSDPTTSPHTYLYPSDIFIPVDRRTRIFCNEALINPENFGSGQSTRALRSVRATRSISWVSVDSARMKRQSDENFVLDCSPGSISAIHCSQIVCNLTNFPLDQVNVTFNNRIDNRYFGNLDSRPTFNLRAYATIEITDGFTTGDNLNNMDLSTFTLAPPPMIEAEINIHVILWPVLGGLIILVVLVIILYFCGFFRRKRKPDEGDIEGDFDAPPGEKSGISYSPQKEALDKDKSMEMTSM